LDQTHCKSSRHRMASGRADKRPARVQAREADVQSQAFSLRLAVSGLSTASSRYNADTSADTPENSMRCQSIRAGRKLFFANDPDSHASRCWDAVRRGVGEKHVKFGPRRSHTSGKSMRSRRAPRRGSSRHQSRSRDAASHDPRRVRAETSPARGAVAVTAVVRIGRVCQSTL